MLQVSAQELPRRPPAAPAPPLRMRARPTAPARSLCAGALPRTKPSRRRCPAAEPPPRGRAPASTGGRGDDVVGVGHGRGGGRQPGERGPASRGRDRAGEGGRKEPTDGPGAAAGPGERRRSRAGRMTSSFIPARGGPGGAGRSALSAGSDEGGGRRTDGGGLGTVGGWELRGLRCRPELRHRGSVAGCGGSSHLCATQCSTAAR